MDYEQWKWMMDWCQKNYLPPANNDVWILAANEYRKMLEERERWEKNFG